MPAEQLQCAHLHTWSPERKDTRNHTAPSAKISIGWWAMVSRIDSLLSCLCEQVLMPGLVLFLGSTTELFGVRFHPLADSFCR